MFLPDVPVSIMFGGLIAASNLRASGGDRAAWRRRSLRQTALFGGLFHCPDSLFAFRWYPDWNLAYVIPWTQVGWGGALLLEGFLFLALLLGCHWATSGRMAWGRAFAPMVTGALAFGAVMAAVWGPYNHIGDHAAYHAGKAVPAATDPTFLMFTTLAGAYLIVPLLTLLVTNHLRAPVSGKVPPNRTIAG